MGLIQKAFGDIITFSRSSNATRIGPTGRVEYAPHNLFLRSQEFDNASWSKLDATVSANSVAAPDGTVTSDKLTENTALAAHELYQSVSITSGIRYTFSFFAKAAGRNFVACGHNGTGSYAYSYFNLSDGTVVSSGTGHTTSIQSVGNGWYRISSTFTSGSTSSIAFEILTSDNGSRVSYTGDGTSGVYLWGAQLSVGPLPLDYTPTTTAAVYGPRFDFDPVTLAARGLLIEEQRTNLFTYSEDYSNAAWAKTTCTVTANQLVAPDGLLTADLIQLGAGTTSKTLVATVTTTSPATMSVYAKAGSHTILQLLNSGTANHFCNFDLGTGVLGNVGSSTVGTITPVGNGWYRCTATFSGTMGTGFWVVAANAAANGYNATTSSTGFYFLWGAQLEAGSFATSYIPTVASTVTRSADVASVNTLSPWYNQSEGSFYIEAQMALDTSGNAPSLVSVDDGTVQNHQAVYLISGATHRFAYRIRTSNVSQADFFIDQAGSTAGAIVKLSAAYKVNDFAGDKNGGTVETDTVGTVPTVTNLKIADYVGDSLTANGWYRRIAYYPRRLTNAELQALTA